MNEKKKTRPTRKQSPNALPEELEAFLREAAKDNKGKPLNLTQDSPLKTLIGRFVEISLEEEMREHLGYDRYQANSPAPGQPPTGNTGGPSEAANSRRRRNTRNGYSGKRLKTTHGETEIRVPRDRDASFEPQIVPKHRTISQEVEARVISMYASGMTTRDIQAHVEELYGLQASEMFVSRLVERLDPELSAWRSRPLEAVYGIVFIDALHLKVRHASGVKSTAAYQVSGYGESGTLEVLGLYMAGDGHSPAESASFWHQVLIDLEQRGVKDILIICADDLSGLEQAIEAVYPSAVLQPCVVHLMRGSMALVSYRERKEVARELKTIYQAPTYEAAEMALKVVEDLYGRRYPHLVEKWRRALPRLANLYQYSMSLRKLVYTTNPIENINRQIRKVTKNRGVLPNVESALRLLTLVVRRIDEKAKKRVRPDWGRISRELAIHFPGRLPTDWGIRLI